MAVTIISRLNQFPQDIILCIGSWLSARQLAYLLRVSRSFHQRFLQTLEPFARTEQTRMKIKKFVAVPLNAMEVAEQWGDLTPEEGRALRMNFKVRPIVFYSEIIVPAMVLLRESFFSVRNNANNMALSEFALNHLDIRQGAVLVSQIPNEYIRTIAMRTLIERAIQEDLPINTILQFTQSFPSKATRIRTLNKLLLRIDMPVEKIKEILSRIPNNATYKKNETVRTLALKEGLGIDKALSIAYLIQDEWIKSRTIYDVARKYGRSKQIAFIFASSSIPDE